MSPHTQTMAKSTKSSMLVLLMLISGCIGEGLQVITVTKGEEAVLPCTLRTPRSQQSCFHARWMKQTLGSSPTTFSVVPDSERDGKALNFNGNLTLKDADEPQEGDYTCQVCEGFSCDLTTNLTLKLRDCKVLESVKVLQFSTATLPCPFYTRGNITWSEIKGETIKPILESSSLSTESSLNSATAANGKRRFRNITAGDASLVITSEEASNMWFRCTVYEGQNKKCSEVNLQVKQKDKPNTSTLSTLTTMVTTAQAPRTFAATSNETVVSVQTESSSWVVTLVVSSVTLIPTIALIVGLYRRWKTTRHTAVTSTWANHHYECVEVPISVVNEEHTSLPTDQEESLCTFIYE
ncbi:uncharacterized protein LOC134023882 isoform X3 [Osmerus eperlanus]|uniref:uncharacterized protein LOC134023882 isoform X3 n=1 Tax=Osmerus eperlanus TaxID=29151 RepID=UPI002E1217DE